MSYIVTRLGGFAGGWMLGYVVWAPDPNWWLAVPVWFLSHVVSRLAYLAGESR